jgi:ABC-2 type transport system permease protein
MGAGAAIVGRAPGAEALRPYLAAFAARFQLVLQYRAAAVSGFATQAWFAAILIMVLAAFYAAGGAHPQPITLAQATSYIWMSQAFLAMAPMGADPDVSAAIRSGAVSYDRLRPVDAYAWWYVRAAAWLMARTAPRALLMAGLAIVILPLLRFGDWAWRPPATVEAAALVALSMVLVVALASAIIMLLNAVAVITLDDRGIAGVYMAVQAVLTGNILPLPLFPAWMRGALFYQPFAGLLDIPNRIWFGQLTGAAAWTGIALQAGWTLVFIAIGRPLLGRVMRRLQVQGG